MSYNYTVYMRWSGNNRKKFLYCVSRKLDNGTLWSGEYFTGYVWNKTAVQCWITSKKKALALLRTQVKGKVTVTFKNNSDLLAEPKVITIIGKGGVS